MTFHIVADDPYTHGYIVFSGDEKTCKRKLKPEFIHFNFGYIKSYIISDKQRIQFNIPFEEDEVPMNKLLIQKYFTEFAAWLFNDTALEVKHRNSEIWVDIDPSGDDWTYDNYSAQFMEFRIKQV